MAIFGENIFNHLNPTIKIWILICCPIFISYRSSGKKLIKYQANSSCVIKSIILMTTLFYKGLISQGEIWRWSLLGLKRVKKACGQTLLPLGWDTIKATCFPYRRLLKETYLSWTVSLWRPLHHVCTTVHLSYLPLLVQRWVCEA